MLRVGGEMWEKIARSWGRHSFSGKLLCELVDCAGLHNLADGSRGRIPHQRHRHCSRSVVDNLLWRIAICRGWWGFTRFGLNREHYFPRARGETDDIMESDSPICVRHLDWNTILHRDPYDIRLDHEQETSLVLARRVLLTHKIQWKKKDQLLALDLVFVMIKSNLSYTIDVSFVDTENSLHQNL